ncbi:hypothetical protein GCM10022223_17590 [Kineosporia mesophila]|uniref:Bulb-type lectin domain-containing protein n=1 Tax=Kineosporia mesophila TaxID=566012 RepID=A0ABP6ZD58_9ACTN|nr:hypothetical protein [Kineosporia mesophila]MCD5352003.1 hypothetical protein [Kineosporia mesophila]
MGQQHVRLRCRLAASARRRRVRLLQSDGNLVLYDRQGAATWATGTFGKSAGWLVRGTDGSLRLYDVAGKQIWTR